MSCVRFPSGWNATGLHSFLVDMPPFVLSCSGLDHRRSWVGRRWCHARSSPECATTCRGGPRGVCRERRRRCRIRRRGSSGGRSGVRGFRGRWGWGRRRRGSREGSCRPARLRLGSHLLVTHLTAELGREGGEVTPSGPCVVVSGGDDVVLVVADVVPAAVGTVGLVEKIADADAGANLLPFRDHVGEGTVAAEVGLQSAEMVPGRGRAPSGRDAEHPRPESRVAF